MTYSEFLDKKHITAQNCGFDPEESTNCSMAFEWQNDIWRWALRKGRAALFEDCGMGKTLQQLMWAKSVSEHTGKPVVIFAPLAVCEQTIREAEKFGLLCEKYGSGPVQIINYERMEHVEMKNFGGVVLDESSILKNFTSRTKQYLCEACACVPFRLCCTATPSPNDYTELGNHAEFLGVMSRTEMLATFFVHDGGDTSSWRLKGHAQKAFFEWLASWACCITSPADIGYSTQGYDLPELVTDHVEVKSENMEDADGQMRLCAPATQTLNERRAARRESIGVRVQKAAEIVNSSKEQYLVWCDLNDESGDLRAAIPDAVEVRGTDTTEHKTRAMMDFSNEKVRCLVSKPSIAGWGMNWQQCHNMIFVGLSDSFEAYYQAIRRCWRYGQEEKVRVTIITSEAEGAVLENIRRKQEDARKLTKELAEHTKEIIKADMNATKKMTEEYDARLHMIVPAWLKTEAA